MKDITGYHRDIDDSIYHVHEWYSLIVVGIWRAAFEHELNFRNPNNDRNKDDLESPIMTH